MDWFYRSDEALKQHISNALQKHLFAYGHSVGKEMRYPVFLEHLEKMTGHKVPLSTFRNYYFGERLKFGFLMMMATVFRIPVASLLDKDFAKSDLANSLRQVGTTVQEYGSSSIGLVIPDAIACSLGIRADTAKTVTVTKENLMSGDLATGNIAVIDTAINTPALTGDYYIARKGTEGIKHFAKLVVSAGGDVKLQHDGSEEELLSKAQIQQSLSILGKVITKLG